MRSITFCTCKWIVSTYVIESWNEIGMISDKISRINISIQPGSKIATALIQRNFQYKDLFNNFNSDEISKSKKWNIRQLYKLMSLPGGNNLKSNTVRVAYYEPLGGQKSVYNIDFILSELDLIQILLNREHSVSS